jgi:galactosamine-6-phosphate isomerase
MNIIVSNTYEELSNNAANAIIKNMQTRENPLLCVASGDSPTGLYEELTTRADNGSLDISEWYFIGLDEWLGMNEKDEGSCYNYCTNHVFSPLKVKTDHICFFNGKTDDTDVECNRIESYISEKGGIDTAIVGLGMNGHIGLNEPGTDPSLRTHVSTIDAVTQKVGQKYFPEQKQLTHGITLGIATLMEAKHLILLVSGKRKAEIVQKALEGEITTEVPASLFRNHKSFTIFLDEEAASLLKK